MIGQLNAIGTEINRTVSFTCESSSFYPTQPHQDLVCEILERLENRFETDTTVVTFSDEHSKALLLGIVNFEAHFTDASSGLKKPVDGFVGEVYIVPDDDEYQRLMGNLS